MNPDQWKAKQAEWAAKDAAKKAAQEAVKAEQKALELDARRYRWLLKQTPETLASLKVADLSNEIDFMMQLHESK